MLGTSGLRKSDEFLQIFPQELENMIDATLGKDLQIHDIESELNYPDHLVVKHKRVNFKFNRFKFEHFLSGVDIEKFEFIPIDKTLFDHIKGSVVPNKFWDCANDFCTYGVGLSLVYENQLVAVAFSSFMHDQKLELGMETRQEYRKNGFATIVCAKLMSDCLEKNLEPIWSCRLGNHGSFNLALKLGFEPTSYLPYYQLLFH